jgi:hypothetical protein
MLRSTLGAVFRPGFHGPFMANTDRLSNDGINCPSRVGRPLSATGHLKLGSHRDFSS